MDKEKQIINSWYANAGNWIGIIESNGIESRKLITNKAIVEAVLKGSPLSVTDIGCGEGWLMQEVQKKGIAVTGLDVVPELIEKAKQRVPGNFLVASYEDIAAGKISFTPADTIVINFALIGKESTELLLASLPRYINPRGRLLIQTLHPYSRKALNDYQSGWKPGSWDGLKGSFTHAYDWYFRTMEDWQQLLHDCGFSSIIVHDVLHPETAAPLSVIFECSIT